MQNYTREQVPTGVDLLVEARTQVRALETKCAGLADENYRLKRELAKRMSL